MTIKAVFLDRDGTIIKEVNYLSRIEQIEILPGVTEAIRLLNENGFLVIIITNQSGVGRNFFSLKTLKEINDHLVHELGKHNARIDDIFVCPHHPDDDCDCRKPKTGLLKKATLKFKINYAQSFMVGDKYTDLKTGVNAGCRTVLVLTGYGKKESENIKNWDFSPTFIAKNLLEAARRITMEGVG